MMTNTTEKKEYLPPTLEVEFVEMEEGIAANSANVTPVDNTTVATDWTDTTTDTSSTSWSGL